MTSWRSLASPTAFAHAVGERRVVHLLEPIESAARDMLDETLAAVRREVPSATAILEHGVPSSMAFLGEDDPA